MIFFLFHRFASPFSRSPSDSSGIGNASLTFVPFRTLFHEGNSILKHETQERVEHYVYQLQSYGLQATIERAEE